jgi:hypothetical protein
VTQTEAITDTETLTETEESASVEGSSIAGLYTSEPIDSGDGTIAGIMVYLGEDGSAQSLVLAFSGVDLPVSRTGEWIDNGDGTLTMIFGSELLIDSANETVEPSDLETPETLDFEVADGLLINPQVTLYPAGAPVMLGAADEEGVAEEGLGEEVLEEQAAEDAAAEEAAAEEATSDDIASSDADSVVFTSPLDTILGGTTAVLVLLEDGSASISVTSDQLTETLIELGTWEADEEAETLTLDFSLDGLGQPLEEPSTLEFVFDPDTGVLTAGDYDVDRYGPDLTLEQVE